MKQAKFNGKGWEFFKIWIVNVMLTLVTLTIYYPWAKVRTRRYFYANTVVEGRNFEYHATGKQLFLAHIISVVLLLIFVLAQNISPVLFGIVGVIAIIGFPWVIWKGLIFNYRMTSFSNVRFNFDGSLGKAYMRYLIEPVALIIIAILVMGLAVSMIVGPMFFGANENGEPTGSGVGTLFVAAIYFLVSAFVFAIIMSRIAGFVINHLNYGQGKFATNLKTSKYTMVYIAVGLLSIVIMAIVGGLLFFLSDFDIASISENSANLPPNFFFSFIGLYLVFLVVGMFARAYSYSQIRSHIYDQTQLDQKVKFKSSLGYMPYFMTMLTNAIVVIVTIGLAYPWAKVRITKLVVENTYLDAEESMDGYVSQQQEAQSAIGEQIGDAFDLGIDVGI